MPTNNRTYQREYMRKKRASPGYKNWRVVKRERQELAAKEKLKKAGKKLKKINKKRVVN